MKPILLFPMLLVATACSHTRALDASRNQTQKEGVVSISSNWIKEKKGKVDFNLTLTNLSSGSIEVPWMDIVCERAGTSGHVEARGDNGPGNAQDISHYLSGDAWGLKAEESRSTALTCKVAKGSDFRVRIKNVYAVVAKDKELVRGKRIAGDLVWSPEKK